MIRRVAAALLAVVAVVCVAFAARAVPESTADTDASSATPAWSPRRLPGPLLDGAAQLRLQADISALLAGTTACVVVDGPAGRIVDDTQGPLTPASTVKLLTALGILAVLPDDFRFTTTVEALGPVDGDRVEQVALVGGGDPLLGTPEWIAARGADPVTAGTPTTSLATLADQLVAAGIREIPGGVVGIAPRWASEPPYLPGWPLRYRLDAIGPIASLTVNGGFRAAGEPAADAPAFAAEELARLLGDRGVTVGDTTSATVAPPGEELARIDSVPLVELVGTMLAVSDNLTAEVLVREVAAARGGTSTADGLATIRDELAALGIPLEGLVLEDGSGLSPSSRVSCEALQVALETSERPALSAVPAGFAVAGEHGTLAPRLVGTSLDGNLRAKTGTLTGATGLVGWIEVGPTLRFSMLANGGFGLEGGFELRDRFAEVLARYPDAPPPELVPQP